MVPILETIHLQHIYSVGTPFEHTALRDISLRISEGEFVGLIGHTGSGKSTLIQHLNGLLKPSSGKVLFRGQDIFSTKQMTHDIRFRVGLVFQYPEYQLFEETVRKDISFGPKNMGLDETEVTNRVDRAAHFVGLTEQQMELSPFELSGGQRRRAAIAGVIAMEPSVLILDEPTSGLDPESSADLLRNIQNYQEKTGAAVLMVSHSMEEVAEYADRLVVLSNGDVFAEGTPREVFSRAAELTAIGLDIPMTTAVLLRLKELGLPVDTSICTCEAACQSILHCTEEHAC